SGVVDDVTTGDDPYLQTFRDAVGAGVPFVMVALATYTKIDPTRLAVFSPAVMNLLRTQIGFDGVIISDDMGEAEAVKDIPPGDRPGDRPRAGRAGVGSPRPSHPGAVRGGTGLPVVPGRAGGGARAPPRTNPPAVGHGIRGQLRPRPNGRVRAPRGGPGPIGAV